MQRLATALNKADRLNSATTVTAFARKTGDIAVLSAADIRVLALCLTLELEENGHWRVRDTPGQVLTGPPKPDESEEKKDEDMDLAEKVEQLEVKEEEPVASTSAAVVEEPVVEEPAVEQEEAKEEAPIEAEAEVEEINAEDEEDDGNDSDSSTGSGGDWITPDNVTAQKVKDLGLFAPPSDVTKPPKSVMKSAVLTGDFAMQNVALQMGLNVLGSGGKRVREVRTWILRCHACYK